MKLLLKRIAKKESYTIGKLYIEDLYFCDTIEDVDRGLRQDMPLAEIKKIEVMHQTAIPTGTYRMVVNMSSSKKRLLPRLLDVPGFDGILIHRGNTEDDSSGCIIVGENKVVEKVINSTKYEIELMEMVKSAGGAVITIE
jgi:hypothetical protein